MNGCTSSTWTRVRKHEYRYLKNALLREKTMDLSVLLTDADEQFVQEGTDPIRRFPETPEELNRYDVVFFGDVDPRGRWLSTSQMNMLLDFIGNEGGGFALIAGERARAATVRGHAAREARPGGHRSFVFRAIRRDAGRRVQGAGHARRTPESHLPLPRRTPRER